MPGPGRDLIDQDEIDRVVRVLRSGYLTRYGPEDDPAFEANVRRFEEEVARKFDYRYALAVSSGTSSLWLILSALGIGPGDEVIVPGFTFIASISSIVYARAVPVLAEVDRSLNLDPVDVEARITPRTKAIMAVHMLGNPARLKELRAVAERHSLLLIEDCAQAFGASYDGRAVGSYGIAGGISFNEYKTITCGDGGMIVTNSEDLYRRAFALHDQGHSPLRLGIEVGQRPFLGLNFRMTELSGAVLRAQFGRIDTIVQTLRRNRSALKDLLASIPGIEFRDLPDPEGDIATHLVLQFPTEEIARSIARELGSKVLADSGWHIYSGMESLLERRTATGRGCPFDCNCTNHEPPTYRAGMLPQTDSIVARSMSIGIGVADKNLGSSYGLRISSTESDIRKRADEIRAAVERHLG